MAERKPGRAAAAAKPVRAGTRRTRDTILAAATASFAERGYDGARIDEIALRAGVPKNLLYYHFGDKDGLFTAVLESVYESIRARQDALDLDHPDPREALRQLVQFTGRIWVRYPEFLRLLHSENLHDARHIQASASIRQLYQPLLGNLRLLVKRGQEAGLFRDRVDPVELYISISSLSAHYISNHRTLEVLLGVRLMGPARVRRRLDHAADVILAWLERPARPAGRGTA